MIAIGGGGAEAAWKVRFKLDAIEPAVSEICNRARQSAHDAIGRHTDWVIVLGGSMIAIGGAAAERCVGCMG